MLADRRVKNTQADFVRTERSLSALHLPREPLACWANATRTARGSWCNPSRAASSMRACDGRSSPLGTAPAASRKS
jgi:hypothetical protein